MRHLGRFIALSLVLLVGCSDSVSPPANPSQPPSTTPPLMPELPSGSPLEPIIYDTTKVADEATRAALTSFDPDTGTLRFSSTTPTLSGLEQDDVLVSEPSQAAPYGYLRKVKEIRQEGSEFILETAQARLTDAVQQGSVELLTELKPEDIAETKAYYPSVKVSALPRAAHKGEATSSLKPLQSLSHEVAFDEVLDFGAGGSNAGAGGQVRVQGSLRFWAGVGLSVTIKPCWDLPPACVSKAEAKVGFEQSANLKLSAKLEGYIKKEITVARITYKTITVWIGPVPVVLVPRLNIVVGADGVAKANFTFEVEESAQYRVGVSFNEETGWQDLSDGNGVRGEASASAFEATMMLRGYGEAEAAILVYGIGGPGVDIRIGAGIDIRIPQSPLWKIFGHISVYVGADLDLFGLVDNELKKKILEFEPTLAEASNYPPRFTDVATQVIQVKQNEEVPLSPNTGGFAQGPYKVSDPEGSNVSISVTSDKDGPIPLTYGFPSIGPRTVTLTARDDQGASADATVRYEVIGSPPELKVNAASDSVAAGIQYFLSATARDLGSGKLIDCSHITWTVESPDVVASRSTSGTACDAAIVFNVQGPRSVAVTATIPQGESTSQARTVNVSEPPPNLPPTIDAFSITDSKGVEVPDGGYFHPGSGTGSYFYPIRVRASASDPTGEPVTSAWTCMDSGAPVSLTDNGDGSFTCDPGADGGFGEVVVTFEASDGVSVTRQSRTFQPGSVVN